MTVVVANGGDTRALREAMVGNSAETPRFPKLPDPNMATTSETGSVHGTTKAIGATCC